MAVMNAATPLLAGEDDPDVEMERHLSCSVCLDLYTDPVLLPCLHSLCRGCVERMTNHESVISLTFRCPECNANVQLSDGGHWSLKRNFPLSSMVSIYKQSTLKRQRSSATLPSPDGGQKKNEYIPISALQRPLPPIPTQKASPPVPAVRHSKTRQVQNQKHQTVPVPQTQVETSEPPGNIYHTLESMGQTQQGVDQGIQPTTSGQELQEQTDAELFASGGPPAPVPEIPRTCCICDSGQARQAETYCETCTLSFCSYCLHGFHPDGVGHTLTQLNLPPPQQQQDVNQQLRECPICDPASPSPPTVRCLECQMTFCDQCLLQCHPSTKTIPGHTLVEIRSNSNPSPSVGTGAGVGTGVTPGQAGVGGSSAAVGVRPGMTAAAGTGAGAGTGVGIGGAGTSQPARGQGTQTGVEPQGAYRRPSGGQGRNSGCSIEGLRSSSQFDMGGLVQLTGSFPCSECAHYTQNMAVINCFDCSRYYCEGCGSTHGDSQSTHTLVDIRLDQADQAPSTAHVAPAPRAPGKSSNVQLKLVELMGIRAEAMAELLRVLEGRRAELERHGV